MKKVWMTIAIIAFGLCIPDIGLWAATRYEETSPAITYMGIWGNASDPKASGGSYKYSADIDNPASATFTFTGTGVSWISDVWYNMGIAMIYLDGVEAGIVDLYNPANLYQQVVYSKTELASGTHTLKIEVTGTKNPSSAGTIIDIDAFEIGLSSGSPIKSGFQLNGHDVLMDEIGKIVSWIFPQDLAYDQVMSLGWNFLMNDLPTDTKTGLRYYFLYSYLNPDTLEPGAWPHNPAGTYAMLTDSALAYYAYSGDPRVIDLAKAVLDHHLAHGMTPANWHWAGVPYASSDPGSPEYRGSGYGDSSGVGDGTGVIEPDKVGEIGLQFLRFYEFTGDVRYRDAAINAANALASHVRIGTSSQSPWPFRVYAQTNVIREQYTAHVIAPIKLFDELVRIGMGAIASYQNARQIAWTWLMTYPIQNNIWANYFEDVAIQSNLSNLNQYTALETTRYLIQHPEFDPDWQTHTSNTIRWVENTFGKPDYFGATPIGEQTVFNFAMGSHTSRYASINALLYEKTGDLAVKEKAYRAFNWATYMVRNNGRVIVGPEVAQLWFTDGYGDYIRHFMSGMGAVPEWAPSGQDHLLQSSSVIKNISYTPSQISYTTFDPQATELFRLSSTPEQVTSDGAVLPNRQAIDQEGWVYDSLTRILKVRHDSSTNIAIVVTFSEPTKTLYEETSPKVTYTGGWASASDPNASGGSYIYSNTPGATATFTFNGSAVAWISDVWNNMGIARVYIDGALDVSVDLYSPSNLYQQVVYSRGGIAAGTHTITIEVTGTKNSGSAGTLIDIDAFVLIAQHVLTTYASPGEGGTITATPQGLPVPCIAKCYWYDSGTPVALSAQPNNDYTFTGWGGDCTGTGPCVVTMNGPISVTATFEQTYTLTVNKAGAGSGSVFSTPPGIDCCAHCSTSFINGAVLSLTAIPDSNSLFAGWSGDCSGTVLSASVTMDAGKVCTATFILGLSGEYYNNSDLTGLGIVRIDPVINFDWGTEYPDIAIDADTFAVRWTGKLQVDYNEVYTFHAVTDDGVRLWMDGHLVLDYWQVGGVSQNNTMNLAAGLHDIKVEFFEDTGAALAQLYWSSPSTPYAIIPNDHLYPPDGTGSSPVLVWVGDAGFVVAGVEPETGDTTTMFTYRAKYTDADGNPPMSGFPRVHILKGGAEITGSPYVMSYKSGDYTGGAVYSFSTTLTAGTDFTYYFDAVDNTGLQTVATPVIPTPTAPVDAPDVAGNILSVIRLGTGSGRVTSSPPGIDCGVDCIKAYNSGDTITLTVFPDAGSAFAGWGGDADCTDGVVTMDAASTCTATFNISVTCGGKIATIVGTVGDDIINGTASADIIAGIDGNDTINGLGGNDTICGGTGNDTLNGGNGIDTLNGGTGNDIMNGGAGVDTVTFATSTAGVTVDLSTGIATGYGNDTIVADTIENITGSNYNDTLMGNNLNNILRGGTGNDTLIGRGGSDKLYGGYGTDTLNGGTGNDTIDGGSGVDTVTFATATAGVTVDLSTGIATGDGSDTIFAGTIENITGSSYNDTLRGDGANNILRGGAGNDILTGLGGTDTLYGGNGNDILDGGSGNDKLYGEAGDDALDGGLDADNCNGGVHVTGDTAANCEIISNVP